MRVIVVCPDSMVGQFLMSGASAPQDLAIMFTDEGVRYNESQLYYDDKTPVYEQHDIPQLLDTIAASCPVRTAHAMHCPQVWPASASTVPDFIIVATCKPQ